MSAKNLGILLYEYATFFFNIVRIRNSKLHISNLHLFVLYVLTSSIGIFLMFEYIDFYQYVKSNWGFDIEKFSYVEKNGLNLDDYVSVFPVDFSWVFLSRAVLLLPVIEEIVFRGLLSPTSINLRLFLCIIFSIVIKISTPLSSPLALTLGAAGFIILAWVREGIWLRLGSWLVNYSRTVFWVCLLLFVIGHNFNYVRSIDDISWTTFLPIYCIPQLFFGYFSSYVVVKKGLGYSIFYHSLNNSIVTAFKWL